MLSLHDEALIVALRRCFLLRLDDCLRLAEHFVPHVTRSTLYRCVRKHGLARMGRDDRKDIPKRKRRYLPRPTGYFYISQIDLRSEWGPLRILVGVDRVTRIALARIGRSQSDNLWESFLFRLSLSECHFKGALIDPIMDWPSLSPRYEKLLVHRTGQGVFTPWTAEQRAKSQQAFEPILLDCREWKDVERLQDRLTQALELYNRDMRLAALNGLTPLQAYGRVQAEVPLG